LPKATEKMPATIDEAVALMKSLPSLVSSANGGKGKQLKYLLFPISAQAFRNHLATSEIALAVLRTLEQSSIARRLVRGNTEMLSGGERLRTRRERNDTQMRMRPTRSQRRTGIFGTRNSSRGDSSEGRTGIDSEGRAIGNEGHICNR
jgi:hypothetical protein